MSKVYVYTRNSNAEAFEKGSSRETQIKKCTNYASIKDLTIDEVINHYSEGLVNSSTIDPLMKKVNQGGVQLSPNEKANLKAFLLTLTDENFINNPNFINP